MLFSKLYQKTIQWSSHRHAPYYLAGVSFAESSFFPIPPDVMLVTMGLAKPKKTWKNALIATVSSIFGGILGYFIGAYFLHFVMPYIHAWGYYPQYSQALSWFHQWGVWVIFLAAFSPIPYKLFTISAGALTMPFLPFVCASIIGRGMRFYLVSIFLYYFGARIDKQLSKYIDILGWSTVSIFVILYLLIKCFA